MEARTTDPSEAAHEVVAALLVRDGRVLLCHRSAGRRWYPDVWDFPGGHVEAGETPRDALARELEEELSILIGEPGPELASVREAGLATRIWLVEQWAGNPVNVSPAEHDDLGWFSASETDELRLAHSSYRSLIRDTLSGLVGWNSLLRARSTLRRRIWARVAGCLTARLGDHVARSTRNGQGDRYPGIPAQYPHLHVLML